MKKKILNKEDSCVQLSLFSEYNPDDDYTDYSEHDKYEVYIPPARISKPIDERYLKKARSLACEWNPEVEAKVYIPIDKKLATIVGQLPSRSYDVIGKGVILVHPPEEPGLIGYRVQYEDGGIDTVYGRQMFPISSSEEISQEQHEQMAKACSLFIQEV